MMNEPRCGYIALVGKPNVGKSTLLNAILNKKISITSPKPQTTRDQILGIKTEDNVQAIYMDTPGIHVGGKKAMNRYLNKIARSSLGQVDVVLFLVEPQRFTGEDNKILQKLPIDIPVILVINKIDTLKNKAEVLATINSLKDKFNFADIIPLSARNLENVKQLEKIITTFLPQGQPIFSEEITTDKDVPFQIAEVIREKIIMLTEQEVPYSTKVEVENFKESEKLIEIDALIWVEKTGQKAIVIGEQGNRLKKIGTAARHELEAMLGKKVFLKLWVKVKENWTDDESFFRKPE